MATKKHKDIIQDLHDHNVNIDKREIFLSNNHKDKDEYDINHTLASQFVKNLRLLDSINHEPIKIHMLAGLGGDVEAGVIIYDSIKNSPSNVTMIVHGSACSMSSIILQAADVRLMMPTSYIMIHYGFVYIDGGAVAAKSLMEKLNEDNERDLKFYIQRCKEAEFFKDWPESKIKKYIKDKLKYKEDWYIDSKQCVVLGLADGIVGESSFEMI